MSEKLGLQAVLDMTLEQFDAATRLYDRSERMRMTDLANTMRAAQHLEGKAWGKFIKDLEPSKAQGSDLAAFLARYGKGF